MLLETIRSPADLRDLTTRSSTSWPARSATSSSQAVAETGGHLGLQPRRRRAHAGPAPGLRLAHRRHPVGHRPPGLRPQDRHRARRPASTSCARPAGCRATRAARRAEHDCVENSHASTILSLRLRPGRRPRRRAPTTHRHIVAVIGDGSMTGGMAYEALNNLGHSGRNGDHRPQRQRPQLRADGVEASSRAASRRIRLNPRLRAPPAPARGRSCATCRSSARQAEQGIEAVKAARPRVLRAAGVLRGARRALRRPDRRPRHRRRSRRRCATPPSSTGPIVVHVLTQKGRGYPPAEDDDEKHLHDAPVFDPAVGPPKAVPTGYTQAFAEAIIKEAEADAAARRHHRGDARPDRAAPVPGPLPRPLLRRRHRRAARRHRAAGMAMGGLRPVVAIYSTFLNRAWDQVVYDVGLHRLPVVFCLDRAGITGDDGAEPPRRLRHGAARQGAGHDACSRRRRAQELQADAARRARPRRRRPGRDPLPEGPGPAGRRDEVGVGPRRRASVREGDGRVCILAVGKLVDAAEQAAAAAGRATGIDATVWDVRCCAPLDPTMIADAARHPLVVTVRGRHPRRRRRHDDRRPRAPRLRRRPAAARRGARRPDAVHPARQARPHPGRARPRRRRHRGDGPRAAQPEVASHRRPRRRAGARPASWPTGPTPSPCPTSGPPTSSWSTRPTAPR